jgi:hypothetical protein
VRAIVGREDDTDSGLGAAGKFQIVSGIHADGFRQPIAAVFLRFRCGAASRVRA